jgi:hypothetical protein
MEEVKNVPCKHEKRISIRAETPFMSLFYTLFAPLKFGYDDPYQRPEIHTIQVGRHYRDAFKLMFH